MLLMVDNYASFTYILVQYFRELGAEVAVFRNDAVTVEDMARLQPAGIVFSPGPGNPDGAGVTLEAIRRFAGTVPLPGVCLGHQAMGQVFGGRVVRAPRLMHGKTSLISHDRRGLFTGMPVPFRATRYHSLILEPGSLPAALEVTAWTDREEIMGVRHRDYLLEASEAFLPASLLEIMPLVEVDSCPIGPRRPGTVSAELLAGYRSQASGEP